MTEMNNASGFLAAAELDHWIGFDWAPYTNGSITHSRAALMIPAKDPATGKRFHLQLDTALSGNLIYADALVNHLHWPAPSSGSTSEDACLWEVEFEGSSRQKQKPVFTLQHGFDPNLDSAHPLPILGSLGLDFLGKTGFALDFPAQRLYFLSTATLDQLEARQASVFHPFSYGEEETHRQIHLPFHLGNQQMAAVFDTGSSMFELLLPPEAWQTLTQATFEQAERKVSVPAWGNLIDIYGQSCHSRILLAGKEFPINECYSWPAYHWKPIIGNQPFLQNVMVFDLRNTMYAIF